MQVNPELTSMVVAIFKRYGSSPTVISRKILTLLDEDKLPEAKQALDRLQAGLRVVKLDYETNKVSQEFAALLKVEELRIACAKLTQITSTAFRQMMIGARLYSSPPEFNEQTAMESVINERAAEAKELGNTILMKVRAIEKRERFRSSLLYTLLLLKAKWDHHATVYGNEFISIPDAQPLKDKIVEMFGAAEREKIKRATPGKNEAPLEFLRKTDVGPLKGRLKRLLIALQRIENGQTPESETMRL